MIHFIIPDSIDSLLNELLTIHSPTCCQFNCRATFFFVFGCAKLRFFLFVQNFVQNACPTDHIDVCFDTTFFAMLLDFTMLK